jgi:hypothetical protein
MQSDRLRQETQPRSLGLETLSWNVWLLQCPWRSQCIIVGFEASVTVRYMVGMFQSTDQQENGVGEKRHSQSSHKKYTNNSCRMVNGGALYLRPSAESNLDWPGPVLHAVRELKKAPPACWAGLDE